MGATSKSLFVTLGIKFAWVYSRIPLLVSPEFVCVKAVLSRKSPSLIKELLLLRGANKVRIAQPLLKKGARLKKP
ncbi:hypothetical protein GCM10027299_13380 [Larkinella ripae]